MLSKQEGDLRSRSCAGSGGRSYNDDSGKSPGNYVARLAWREDLRQVCFGDEKKRTPEAGRIRSSQRQ